MKKTLSVLLALTLALMLALPVCGADFPAASGGVSEIQKYGNLVLDIAAEKLTGSGYAYGDVLAVTVDGKEYEAPLCTNYSDVNTGELVLRDNGGTLILAINMGDFASTNGVAVKNKAEDGTVTWTVSGGRELKDIAVSIAMKEQGGYRDQYLIHQLARTDERSDYASDQIFANFRAIPFGSLGKNTLFRSSSPVNNEIGRAAYADAFAKENHIRTVLNLANSAEEIQSYFTEDGFNSPYYKSLYEAGGVKALGLGVDFTAADFKSGLADGLRFLAANEGPYLVHCNEGKDRAGFASALLSCFMGATYEQVVDDYMTTYENYYHLERGSEQYEAVKNSNIVSILSTITGAKAAELSKTDLSAAALAYMKGIGLTDAECAALRANLAKDYVTAETPAEVPAQTPAEKPAETPAAPAVPAEQPAAAPAGTYTVAPGDCLWTIARKTYGNGQKWQKIYEANRDEIRDPAMIQIGQVLTLPAA